MTNVLHVIPTSNDADQTAGTFTTRAKHLNRKVVSNVLNVCGFVLKVTNVLRMIPTSNDADQTGGTFTTRAEHFNIKVIGNVRNVCRVVLKMTDILCEWYLPATTPTKGSSRSLRTLTSRLFKISVTT
jgi:hypothetical protein